MWHVIGVNAHRANRSDLVEHIKCIREEKTSNRGHYGDFFSIYRAIRSYPGADFRATNLTQENSTYNFVHTRFNEINYGHLQMF